MLIIEHAIERSKAEILEDIAAGRVPSTVSSFSELHDYVDANEYGGLCESGTWWCIADDSVGLIESDTHLLHFGQSVAVQNAVDAWLQHRICSHDAEYCDGAEFCETCHVQIFSGYVYGDERYCNDHQPATWDAEVAAMSSDEFDEQDDIYWTQWEICDIFCECPTDCPCRPSSEALQALYDADRAREGIA